MNIPCETEWIEYDLIRLKEDECVIYSLYNDEYKIIYIGRTQSFTHRMVAHLTQKKGIKRVRYFITRQEISEEVEKYLIGLYRPKLNIYKKPKERIFYERITEPIINIEDLRNFLSENSIDISYVSKNTGYSEKFLKKLINGTVELKKRTSISLKTFMRVYFRLLELDKKNGEVKAEYLLKGESI